MGRRIEWGKNKQLAKIQGNGREENGSKSSGKKTEKRKGIERKEDKEKQEVCFEDRKERENVNRSSYWGKHVLVVKAKNKIEEKLGM